LLGTGGATFAGVEAGVLPGRTRLRNFLGQNGPETELPQMPAGHTVSGSFVSSRRLGKKCGWTIAYPSARVESLPVVVVLHGKGANHHSVFGDELGLDRYLAQAGHRYALASVDGGDTYWHRRRSGEDAGAMVTEEFLPLLADQGLDTSRIGLMGWSMGGFGSLWLGGQLGLSRVAGVAVMSPALWHTAGETAPGAYDDAEDFTAHNVFTRTGELRPIPVRVDCGTGDGFYPAARDYAHALVPHAAGTFETGAHDYSYWRRMAPAQLQFLATALSQAPTTKR